MIDRYTRPEMGRIWTQERKSLPMKFHLIGNRWYIERKHWHTLSGLQPYAQYVLEKHLKRKLHSWEIAHHINGDTKDDRIENLEVLDRSEHLCKHLDQGDLQT